MPKKKGPPEKPEEQFRRFIDMAKAKGVDSDRAVRKFKRLAPKSKKKSATQ